MQYADPALTWNEWVANNADRDEMTKLLALHEYIHDVATEWAGRENITAEWLNKKLESLGLSERIQRDQKYEVEVNVTGKSTMIFWARNRADALDKAGTWLDTHNDGYITNLHAASDTVVLSGPEDPIDAPDPDAPTTVDATLVKLREVIMLGHIAGPRYCENGANKILASFGLDPIPPRKTFTVTRPVEATASTTVEAYDEASAMRVAGWRWENERRGYTVEDLKGTDAPAVVAAS